jgi:hypothetical protein
LQNAVEELSQTGFEDMVSLDGREVETDLVCHEIMYNSNESESSLGSIYLNNNINININNINIKAPP